MRRLRTLRFRLVLIFVLFFAVLLSGLGLVLRHALKKSLYDNERMVLDQDRSNMRAYLRIIEGTAWWIYDNKDPDETFTVERLRRVYLLADAEGRVMEKSRLYEALGIDSPEKIRAAVQRHEPMWETRYSSTGTPYLLRIGVLKDEQLRQEYKNKPRQDYFVSIGRSLADADDTVERFTWLYFAGMVGMVAASLLLGLWVAGRALQPVHQVAQAAQRITSSNLRVTIPRRGVHDELDELIASFNRMTASLDEAFTQTRQFSTDVSHELRTPLTAIRGELELALLTARTEDQWRDAVASALEDLERLSQTVRTMLLLAQAESGQVTLRLDSLDMSALVEDMVEQCQLLAEAAGLTLRGELEARCTICADRSQIDRLLYNLISNAIKYTPAGGTVLVRLFYQGEEVVLDVEDTGYGIPADHLPHIFNRFYRVPRHHPQAPKGLGLGLSFVAWIVQAHKGRIDVQSTVGVGTRFRVMLPKTAPQVEERPLSVAGGV